MRAFGKGYEEFYNRIKEEGIHIIRGKTAQVEKHNGSLKIRGEDISNDKLIENEVDMVVLAVGLESDSDSKKLAEMLNLNLTENGWFKEANQLIQPTDSGITGIHLAGVCQGPKDIPDTVAQASAAASKVIQSILKAEKDTVVKN